MVYFEIVVWWEVYYFAIAISNTDLFLKNYRKYSCFLILGFAEDNVVETYVQFTAQMLNALMALLFANIYEHLLLSRGVTKLFSIILTLKN